MELIVIRGAEGNITPSHVFLRLQQQRVASLNHHSPAEHVTPSRWTMNASIFVPYAAPGFLPAHPVLSPAAVTGAALQEWEEEETWTRLWWRSGCTKENVVLFLLSTLELVVWEVDVGPGWTRTSDGRGRVAVMADGVGMFSQLTALMFSCSEVGRELALIVTVTVHIHMLHAHAIQRRAARPRMFSLRLFWAGRSGTDIGMQSGPSLARSACSRYSPALADSAEFHVPAWDLLSPTLAGILRFNDQQSFPSSGSVTITSTLPLLQQMQLVPASGILFALKFQSWLNLLWL